MLETGDVLDVPFLTSVTSEEGLYPTAGNNYTENIINIKTFFKKFL